MGPAVEEASKEILSDVLKCLTNNMKHMGECTLAAALYKMILILLTVVCKDLFDWLTKPACNRSDEDVRKTAEGCLFEILRMEKNIKDIQRPITSSCA
ncbi:unnamed protein product [Arabidopsis thaliana]|uniref:Uncharacterized protein n=1 Tax=Arabidopsis thaliana TaxID=3702 RepID=Q9LJP9_ARATH|nr:unnamed protein product [Arabidopsis thaliana]